MACGDITPNDIFLPACGLAMMTVVKSSIPSGGGLVDAGDEITWQIVINSNTAGPAGISVEDIFDDCTYLEGLSALTLGWTLTPDGGNPCRFILDNPAATNPGVHVIRLSAIAGANGPAYEGFGTLRNTANILSPEAIAGNSVELIFAPLLIGVMGDKTLNTVVNYQYTIKSGTGPFVVSLFLGTLPTGLAIDANGLLTGTTTVEGSYTFTLQLMDANGNTYLLSDECLVTALATRVDGNGEAVESLGLSLTTIAMS